MSYTMALILADRELSFPVLPDKIEVSAAGKNEKATVLKLGEVSILRKKGLRIVAWKSFFPASGAAPYVSGAWIDPIEAVRAIGKARDLARPVRLILTGADLDVNMRVGIDDFSYDERGGEVGDLYYSIKLIEWMDYAPRRIVLPQTATESARLTAPERPGAPPAAKSHTVIAGDCLWSIAQQHYGDGSRYPELYEANKAVIDGKNKGTGNPKYTIYPRQVLIIP